MDTVTVTDMVMHTVKRRRDNLKTTYSLIDKGVSEFHVPGFRLRVPRYGFDGVNSKRKT